MKKFLSLFLSVLIVFFCFCSAFAAEQTVIYVSVEGSANADGSFENPYTLTQAKEALKNYDGTEKITVYLRGGDYFIEDTLSFTSDDADNVEFVSFAGETAHITSAKPVTAFKETTINGVRAFEYDTNGKKVTALFKNGKKLDFSRLPEDGFYYVDSVNTDDNLWTEENAPNIQNLGSHSLNAAKSDISSAPSNLRDVSVCVVHMWQEELSPLEAFDSVTGRLTLKKYSSHTIEKGDRYFLENVKDALDKPGEWCFDSSESKVYYIPEANETVESCQVSASSQARLMTFDGCNNIGFKNIVFENTGWEYASREYLNLKNHENYGVDMDVTQAGIDVCAAVTAQRCSGLSFENCEFLNIGCTAIKLTDECADCTVESCYFNGIGASAVFAGGQNNGQECAGNIRLYNNEIGNYGCRFFRAPGVIFTFVQDSEIKNNNIHDGNYTGISCGWVWLYGSHITHNINIENNLIYNIGLGMLSDMGGIYMLGVQSGSKIHGNIIHDVLCYQGGSGYAGTGIYTDAGSSEMELYNNLVFNCSTAAFNATIGKNNRWYNNIAAFCGDRLVNPPQNYMTFVSGADYHGNIFLTDSNVAVVSSLEQSELLEFNNNIIWDYTDGAEVYFNPGMWPDKIMTYKKACKKGYIGKDNLLADPCFKDAGNYDFSLTENSPAADIGFEPWDYSASGTVSGTTVGLSHPGGETLYNENVNPCKSTSGEPTFFMKLAAFFSGLFERIKAFFVGLFNSL